MFLGEEIKLSSLEFIGSFPAFFTDSRYIWPFPVF